MSCRLVSASLAALLMSGGCTGSQSKPITEPRPLGATAPLQSGLARSPSPAAGGAGFDATQLPKSPDGLANATTAYAQLVQRISPPAEQAAPATQPAAAPEQPAPSAMHMPMLPDLSTLKWLAGDFKLALGPRQEEPAASVLEPQITIGGPEVLEPKSASPAPAKPEPRAMPDDLERQLTKRLKENPRDIAAQLDYQLFEFVRGRTVPQLDAISSLDAEDREVLSALLDAVSNFRANARGGGTVLLAAKVRPLVELHQRLSGTNLRVTNLAFCRKVDGFGIYDRVAADRFEPQRGQQVIVYCEVENFSSQFMAESKTWETHLSEELVIYDAAGRQVWIDRRQKTRDTCRTRRKDFSLAKMVFLPALPMGRYTMTVSVQDEQAQRLAEASLPFAIGEGHTAAAR